MATSRQTRRLGPTVRRDGNALVALPGVVLAVPMAPFAVPRARNRGIPSARLRPLTSRVDAVSPRCAVSCGPAGVTVQFYGGAMGALLRQVAGDAHVDSQGTTTVRWGRSTDRPGLRVHPSVRMRIGTGPRRRPNGALPRLSSSTRAVPARNRGPLTSRARSPSAGAGSESRRRPPTPCSERRAWSLSSHWPRVSFTSVRRRSQM